MIALKTVIASIIVGLSAYGFMVDQLTLGELVIVVGLFFVWLAVERRPPDLEQTA